MDDVQVVNVTRPPNLRAGFHADIDDPVSGLQHAGEQWAAPRYLITPHVHPVWEFYLQVHGLTRWIVGQDVVAVRPGELVGVPAGVRHHMSEPPGGNHHFYFAAVDVPAVLNRHSGLARVWPTDPTPIHCAGGPALVDAFEQLVREAGASSTYAPEGRCIAVDLLVLQISRLLLPDRPTSLLAIHPAVARVRDLLDRDLARGWTLGELAEQVGLAPTYLSGLFATATGSPPHTYRQRQRVNRAVQLLETSDLSITAISLEVGFGSSQHFARVFRQVTGHSPREHRAWHGAGLNDVRKARSARDARSGGRQ